MLRWSLVCAAAGQSSCDRDRLKKASYGAPESGWPLSDSRDEALLALRSSLRLSGSLLRR